MPHNEQITRVFRGFSLAAAYWFILVSLVIALCSIHYPYPLEWMEGQTVDVMARILRGESLYVAPTVAYVPFIYPPLYFYVAALFAQCFGVDFFAVRLLSLLCAVGIGWLLFHWVKREGGDSKIAAVGAGLFYGSYMLSSRWLDIGRVDSLYLLLLCAALYLWMHYSGWRAACATAALCVAAFFTKQNTLIAFAPLLLIGLWQRPRHSLLVGILAAAAILAIGYGYNQATEGWLYYYLIEVPASHRIDRRYLLEFWTDDLAKHCWPLLLVAGAGWWSLFREDRAKALRYLALAAGLIGAAYAGRLHRYGWANVLIPAYWALALCAVLAVAQWQRRQQLRHVLCGWAALALQLYLFYYNPALAIPDDDARNKGDALMEKIAQIDGEVLMPELQFIQSRVGKQSYSYGFAAIDVLQSQTSRPEAKDNLRREMNEKLAQHYFSAVITSSLFLRYGLEKYYTPELKLSYPPVVAGYHPRPLIVWRPKPAQERAP